MTEPYVFEPDSVDEVAVERKAVVKTGGYYDVGNKKYWIPAAFYDEVVERDNGTPLSHKGDKEFAKWLKDFIEEHDIKESFSPNNTRSLSGYWAMPFNKYKNDTSDRTIKLARVLRAMKSVVSVVDPEHKLSVEYNPELQTSGWDAGSRVLLPVEPVDEVKDLEDCINVMGGFTIHEAFHSQETRKILDLNARLFLANNSWNMYIANLLEDTRIEEVGLRDTPGYGEYLNYTKEYLWNEASVPSVWPTGETEYPERYRIAIGMIRYEDRIDEFLTHESFKPKTEWLRDWAKRYGEAQGDTPTSANMIKFTNEGRAYLEIPDEAGMEPGKVMLPCMAATGSVLNPGSQEMLVEAMEEESDSAQPGTKDWEKLFHHDSSAMPGASMRSVIIKRPRNKGKYQPSRGDLIEKAKAAISLRKTQMQHDTRQMLTGVLDEDELYRLYGGDLRVFKDATVESLPSAAVYMLVDMSGSMGYALSEGSAAYYATKMAQILVEALSKNPNVKLKVLGHSGDRDAIGGEFYRIWEPGDSLDRLSILADGELYCENYDGWAISWAGNMLREEVADQKLLVVLADGSPAASRYGGEPAMDHVRSVTDRLGRAGVTVVQVAVSHYLHEEQQARMFKHYIEVDAKGGDMFPTILRKLTKLLQKVI